MKKICYSLLLVFTCFFSSCDSVKNLAGSVLSEYDAANAIREALMLGTNSGVNSLGQKGSFSRDVLLNAILPQEVNKVITALDKLGLASQVNRFTNTLDNAVVESVKRSGPIFLSGIKQMSIRDAIGIVKNGGTAATDYLRRTVGDTLRGSVRPVVRTALNEYNIANEWDKLVSPVKSIIGNNSMLNIDLDNILTVMLTNEMFKQIEIQETAIRTQAAARTTPLLQRVFGSAAAAK
ncbi:DUF4197 domain-containing protein [Sediminibacterium ginsengisoli]|uniref:DUF4197 domain-containing protein n=1 Tax=Sediminibacterium ginsengisoli TaxID=413434 RepID=A0A1T4M5T7_9BACT|nr:DUF4197 domain-containing protein [Sediminibacterium ginsengisoli]SJZ62380.1 Protein of unknown function [Sediminibacterium ginsengisoli]